MDKIKIRIPNKNFAETDNAKSWLSKNIRIPWRMVHCVTFLLMMMVAFCPAASAGSSKKFEFLLRFFDMNEAAFAYHRHCLSRSETINDTFLRTLEIVADELFAEAKKDDPRMGLDYIKTTILERRFNLQYRLDHENMENGCHTPATEMAKAHYEEFSRYNMREIREFIDEETGG